MIEQLYEAIKKGNDIRKNLIQLRKAIKDDTMNRVLFYTLKDEPEVFYDLLGHEDAKVRKNVALILGELEIEESLDYLYQAYEKEEKMFVKSDYLMAMGHLNYEALLEPLKLRLDTLTKLKVDDTSRKHIDEEIRTLSRMCLKYELPTQHKFTGYKEESDIILLTNRDHKEITLNQLTTSMKKTFNAGIIARVEDLTEVLKIRTYSEILFRLKDVSRVSMNPLEAAKTLYESDLLAFLKVRHEGWPPFYFRIEMKTRMPLDKKSTFTKKMASELERLSNRELINSTSNYEFEIRLIENKEGYFNVLIKLYTLKDKRFDYRKNTVAASIAPDDAALIVELAKPYLDGDAQVLDPFCGVGTMLIERNQVVSSQVMYGVDLYGAAIDGAIENANYGDTAIYFVTKDILDFTHKYMFDEIFTNMPTQSGRTTYEHLSHLYHSFFVKVPTLLRVGGILVLYTRNKDLLDECMTHYKQYKLRESYIISKKEDAYLYILELQSE